MTTVLLEDEYTTVALFIENLLWGKIKANFYRKIEQGESSQYNNEIKENIYRYTYLRTKKNTSLEEDQEFYDINHMLYCLYLDGRIDGTIEGELHDIDHENEVSELKTQIENWKSKYEKSREDNKLLSEELLDKTNIISAYEENAYKK